MVAMIGERIRKHRQAKEWTQRQLGDVIGVSQSTICDMETGAQKIDTVTAKRLAMIFDVTLDELAG